MADYSKSLVVYIGEDPIGVVSQNDNGRFRFSYYDDYDSTPLSLSMPVANIAYGHKVVLPYLMGLLPDEKTQRQALANRHDISPNNPIALLNFIGFDCPGAVRFFPQEETIETMQAASEYVPLSQNDIGAELNRIKSSEQPSWQLPKEHWSLGGTQSKIAVARFDGQWFRCEGDAATTHIIKPGIERLKHEALNECLCQNAALACGLPASKTSFEVFDGIPALVSERFDRQIEGPKKVRRLHQEDFCQALSIEPTRKYSYEGGPSSSSILSLLDKNADAEQNKILFTAQLFFNYLIGAPDAHGKNYSILLDRNDVTVAPLYDCASGLAYDDDEVTPKAAMAIGGERRFFHLGKANIRDYAKHAKLSDAFCLQLMRDLAENILDDLNGVFARFSEFDGARELEERMKPRIILNCRGILRSMN